MIISSHQSVRQPQKHRVSKSTHIRAVDVPNVALKAKNFAPCTQQRQLWKTREKNSGKQIVTFVWRQKHSVKTQTDDGHVRRVMLSFKNWRRQRLRQRRNWRKLQRPFIDTGKHLDGTRAWWRCMPHLACGHGDRLNRIYWDNSYIPGPSIVVLNVAWMRIAWRCSFMMKIRQRILFKSQGVHCVGGLDLHI